MVIAKEPSFEKERVEVLKSYSILDTLPETDYDNLTTIASEVCNTPISLISLLDDKRQWFKSHHGTDAIETPKKYAFCAHAIIDPNDIFIVPDTYKDNRFFDNPLVTGEPYVRFYAGVPLKNNQGLPLGTICVVDLKPNSLNETQINILRALSIQTMNLLELRKSKTENEKLIDDLNQRNKELEQFAYIAAHDIKSPLNNISTISSLLLRMYSPKLDGEGIKLIKLAQSSCDKLRNLIDDLLKYYSIEKIINEELSTIHLEELKYYIRELFFSEDECSIILKSNLDVLVVNKTAFKQILGNLVKNAIKHNDKDTTEIEIEILDNDEEYMIYVNDNGPGIPKGLQNDIFKMFKSISSSKKDNGQTGNGLGLVIVKKIVDALGGKIWVESEIGEGSKFVFTMKKKLLAYNI